MNSDVTPARGDGRNAGGPVVSAPFAWAGFRMTVPASFRPYQIDGDGRGGFFVLGDEGRARLELRWAMARRGPDADGEDLCRYRLRRTLGRKGAAEMMPRLKTLTMPGWAPMLHLVDEAGNFERFMGFNQGTGRVMDMVYHLGSAAENRLVRDQTLPSLTDVSREPWQPWAFFDLKFMTPEGFQYLDATLNVGDMKVVVGRGADVWKGPWLSVRQLYPADLALARMTEDGWMDMVMEEDRKFYRPWLKRAGKNRMLFPRVKTARGPALVAEASLVWRLRPFFRRIPRHRRTWLIHDRQVNRLVILHAAGARTELDPRLHGIVANLHREEPDAAMDVPDTKES